MMNNNFQLSQQADPNKIFITKFSELERRFDPDYYKPSYKDIKYKIQTANTTEFLYKIADVLSGSTPAKLDYSNDETKYPIIKVASYQNDFIKLSKVSYTKQKNSALSKKDDIYILSSAHQANYVGRFMKYLSSKPKENTAFVGELLCIRGLKNNHKYLFSILNTEVYKTLINREKRGQTSHIYPKDIKNIKIPIPPKNIQAKIVAKMDTAYQDKKDKEAQAQNLLDSIDDYLLNELGIDLPKQTDNNLETRIFTKKFSNIAGGRFDAISSYTQIYEKKLLEGKTEAIKLKAIVSSVKTGSTPHNKLDPYTDKGISFLRNTNISNSFINLSKVKFIKSELKSELTYSSKNDVIICIAGTVGNSAVNTYNNLSINQNITSLTLHKNKVNPYFLNCYFNSDLSIKLVKRQCSIATILYINNDNLLNLYIPLPPLEKQNQIAEHISLIRKQAKQLQTEAKTGLEQEKQQVEDIILGNTL